MQLEDMQPYNQGQLTVQVIFSESTKQNYYKVGYMVIGTYWNYKHGSGKTIKEAIDDYNSNYGTKGSGAKIIENNKRSISD